MFLLIVPLIVGVVASQPNIVLFIVDDMVLFQLKLLELRLRSRSGKFWNCARSILRTILE
jgi:hypothetical protein